MNCISPHDGPIFPELEGAEITFAKDQPEYRSLRTLTDHATVLTRWTPTADQRQAIMDGADLYLELLTFGGPLQPIRITVGMTVEEGKGILGLG